MAVQIAHAPAQPRQHSTAGAIGVYLWMRFHRMLGGVALLCLISTIADRLFFAGAGGATGDIRDFSHLLLMMLPPGALIIAPVVAVFEIEDTLWVLPLRTKTLVGWLIFYGCASISILWCVVACCIWKPAGWDLPVLWPAAGLAAALSALFAIRRLPLSQGSTQFLILYLLTLGVLVGGGALAIRAPQILLTAGYLAVIPIATVAAIAGSARVRRGDLRAAPASKELGSEKPLRERFSSPILAQVSKESRGSRYLAATVFATCGIFTLPALFAPYAMEVSAITALTHGAHTVNAAFWADVAPPMLALLLAGYAITGGMTLGLGADGQDLKGTLAAYPVSFAVQVAAKLRIAGGGSMIMTAALLPYLAIWMALPASEGGRHMHLGVALWSALGDHAAAKIGGALLLLPLLLWKIQTESLCVTLTRRRWISSTFYLALFGLLAIPQFSHALWASAQYLITHLSTPPVVAGMAAAALVKAALSTVIIIRLRQRDVISTQNLRSALTLWLAVAALFFAAACAAFVPAQISWPSSLLAVILLMPGVRLALAPLALAWGRSQ